MNEVQSGQRKRQSWFGDYAEIRSTIDAKYKGLEDRLKQLGADAKKTVIQTNLDNVATAVHESNWQEGIELNPNRTRELAAVAFKTFFSKDARRPIPHLDSRNLLRQHYRLVLDLVKKGETTEEIAAYNLSAIYLFSLAYSTEIQVRARFLLEWRRKNLADKIRASLNHEQLTKEERRLKQNTLRGLDRIGIRKELNDLTKLVAPFGAGINTRADLYKQFCTCSEAELRDAFDVDDLHFLHKALLCGIEKKNKTGRFRTTSVHVGNPNLTFPIAKVVLPYMKEFCSWMSSELLKDPEGDAVMLSAQVSHRFVLIHPYKDGNGRLSRVLMNLVLTNADLPLVSLKADAKGRHRYITALRRADRGNIEPLACLIGKSVLHSLDKMLACLAPFSAKHVG